MNFVIVNDLKPGLTFSYEKDLYTELDIQHNKTPMRQMIIKVKVKNLRSGAITDISFTGGDKVEEIHLEKKTMQYLYDTGEALALMDVDTYDQIEIQKDSLEWEMNFLKPSDNVTVTTYEGEVLGVSLPDKVNLEVVECEDAVKGDTATSAQKNAVLETGWQIKVPLFIKQGEIVTVTTTDGKYAGRA